ncbi:YceI family protein [Saccharopolyspora oryzae]|uniref:YceI family protein n=1 Tax=Saccharopolyspora oryzae TaxID=2997343 RepID=A0ABT4USX9_9PSEU|nr:YceI family protein [Saccharopolyspora oryzae]MDA3624807.1 YceI family protein [Saccharopolyspora oryzae]
MTRTNALPLVAGRWAIDPLHSSVGFAIRHLGVSKVRGRFSAFDAELVVGEGLEDSSISANVEIGSIDTGNADRDAHVLAADLLDVEKRPTMTFRSTRISGEGEDWTLDGELTIGSVTRPVGFAVEFGGVQDVFDGSRHAGFDATAQIRRSDFGIDFGPAEALLGDVIKIQLDVQFVEPKS